MRREVAEIADVLRKGQSENDLRDSIMNLLNICMHELARHVSVFSANHGDLLWEVSTRIDIKILRA